MKKYLIILAASMLLASCTAAKIIGDVAPCVALELATNHCN